MDSLERTVSTHPFLEGLEERYRQLIAGCARHVHFREGEYLFRQGDAADQFFLIREGRVALEILPPGQPAIVIMTLGKDEVVGASWLFPPYRWTLDALAKEATRAIGIDAACLRRKCEADHDLGYEMMMRFIPVFLRRLHATRLQLLDVYRRV